MNANRVQGWLKRILTALIATYLVLALLPTPFVGIGTGLDPSWMWALNMAHQRHLVFGTDIVYTFGPLGYLTVPTFPEARWSSVLKFELLRYSLSTTALIAICIRVRPFWRAAAIVVLLAITTIYLSGFRIDLVEFAGFAAALFLYAGLPKVRAADLLGFCLIAGFCTLTKFNVGVEMGALLLGYVSALSVIEPRSNIKTLRVLFTSITLTIFACACLFRLAGNPVLKLPAYFAAMLPVVLGYSEAMQVAGNPLRIEIAIAILFALFSACVLAEYVKKLLPAFFPAVSLCFFVFKEGVVRHDSDKLALKLVVPVLFLLLFAHSRRDRILFAALACLTLSVGIPIYRASLPNFYAVGFEQLQLKNVPADLNALFHFRQQTKALEALYPLILQPHILDPQIRAEIGTHTVDVVPQYQDYIRANHMEWNPRPAFQSFSTYTPELDRSNQSHIDGSRAADKIIFGWETLDFRHRLSDDPLTTLAIIDWYDLESRRPDFRLLTRRPSPRLSDQTLLGEVTARWNEFVQLPPITESEILLMETEIDKSLFGSLLNTLFRIDEIFIDARLRSGAHVRGRTVRANLASGIIISDWPRNLEESDVFWDKEAMAKADRVSSVCFRTVNPRQYGSLIHIRWLKVTKAD